MAARKRELNECGVRSIGDPVPKTLTDLRQQPPSRESEQRVRLALRVLVVEDEPLWASSIERVLRTEGYVVDIVGSVSELRERLEKHVPPDVILLDVHLPDGISTKVIPEIRDAAPLAVILCVTSMNRVDYAVDAMRAGAFDYVSKSSEVNELLERVGRGAAEAIDRLRHARATAAAEDQLLGRSRAMREVRQVAQLASQSQSTVLISGETGTGKSRIARAIHSMSPRREKPFVTVDCAALSTTLAESELFGHVRGAFTGAVNHRTGAVEAAKDGTLFFDEVSDLPATTQGKLLRVLEDRLVRPIGGNRDTPVRARIIGATRRSLSRMVRDRSFREDLYFRFSVLVIRVPPLRDRPEDVPQLARHFASLLSRPDQRHELSDGLLERLRTLEFPGNIRELRNLVERLALLHGDKPDPIDESALDLALRRTRSHVPGPSSHPPRSSEPADESQDEARRIADALLEAGGRIGEAADRLGMSRHALRRRLKKHKSD
jgi:DNA-binding NtrC family response regulator